MSNTSLDSSATAVTNDVDGDRRVNTSAANVGDLVRLAEKPEFFNKLYKAGLQVWLGFNDDELESSPSQRADTAAGYCPADVTKP